MRQIPVFILVCSCLWAGKAVSQPASDSLYQAWTNAALPDTQRLESVRSLIVKQYLYSKPDSAQLLAGDMYRFAEQRRLKRYMGQALVIQAIVLQQRGPYAEGLKLAERAVELYRELGFEKGIFQAYTTIAILKEKMGDTPGALAYYKQSLPLAIKLKDKQFESVALSNIGNGHLRLGETEAAGTYFERALVLAQERQDPVALNATRANLGHLHHSKGAYGRAMHYFSQAAQGFEAQGNLQKKAEMTYMMAILHEQTGKYDSAMILIDIGLALTRNLKNTAMEAALLNLLGGISQRKGNYQEAVALLTRCLRLYDSIGNKLGVAATFGNLGNIYRDQRDYEQAGYYYGRCRALNDSMGNKRGLAMSLSSLGDILADQGRYDEAMIEYTRSLQLAEEAEAQQEIAYARQVMGKAYLKQNDLENAEANCARSLEINQAIGNRIGEAGSLNCLASVALSRKDYAQAIRYGEQAIGIARAVGIASEIQPASLVLYQAYKATGNTASALGMYEVYIQYRDSTESLENTRAILKERFQYEQDKKDALAKEELARRNLQRNASLGGLGLVAVLAGVLFVNGRRRRQTNILLTAQKAEIQAKNSQNELLLKEIHHRVKNSLQTISSLLYLQSAHIKDPEVRDAVAAGQHRVESMALIHQKLYQRDTLAAIEMKDYLSNLVTSLISTFAADPERIRVSLDMPELELDVDTAVPLGLIVNELITNSLKYAFPDGREGTVTVRLHRTGEALELLVSDDGIGSANTATGTAFGSQLVRLLTSQLGGTLEQGSGQGYWTKVRVG
ncbi:MAG: tetratricopeptide repeat protein [Bacteroidia bacterium]|nr:tetratricopeptide repeat protein [Bacteroidia bacterium]